MVYLYFKYPWPESSGELSTDHWGCSIYYFETDAEFTVIRQLQMFEKGALLKYDTEYLDDKYGGLAEKPLNPEESEPYRITKEAFEQVWETAIYRRFPEIVCTADTLWGQPRLEGRRLAVGDIVSLVDIHDDLSIVLKDWELSLQEVRQALHYCKDLYCKKDAPEKFCHNCVLRLEQFLLLPDPEDPEQENWLRAGKLYQRYFQK